MFVSVTGSYGMSKWTETAVLIWLVIVYYSVHYLVEYHIQLSCIVKLDMGQTACRNMELITVLVLFIW